MPSKKMTQKRPVALYSGFVAIFLLIGGTPLKATENSKAGKELLTKKGCLNCHYVKGDGGFIAPPLDGIGQFKTKIDIVKMLTEKTPSNKPKKTNGRFPSPEELMSHVKLNEKDAQTVAQYLISLPKDDSFEIKGHNGAWKDIFPMGSQFKPHPPSRLSKQGKKLFYKNACIACHLVEGKGGRAGPSLDGVGTSRSRSFIEKRIADGAIVMKSGAAYQPSKYSMPPSTLSKQDIEKISEYLLTLKARPSEDSSGN